MRNATVLLVRYDRRPEHSTNVLYSMYEYTLLHCVAKTLYEHLVQN